MGVVDDNSVDDNSEQKLDHSFLWCQRLRRLLMSLLEVSAKANANGSLASCGQQLC